MDATWYVEAVGIEVKCPGCGRKTQQSIGVLKNSPILVCPSCKERLRIDGELLQKVARAAADQINEIVRLVQNGVRVEVAPANPSRTK